MVSMSSSSIEDWILRLERIVDTKLAEIDEIYSMNIPTSSVE